MSEHRCVIVGIEVTPGESVMITQNIDARGGAPCDQILAAMDAVRNHFKKHTAAHALSRANRVALKVNRLSKYDPRR